MTSPHGADCPHGTDCPHGAECGHEGEAEDALGQPLSCEQRGEQETARQDGEEERERGYRAGGRT